MSTEKVHMNKISNNIHDTSPPEPNPPEESPKEKLEAQSDQVFAKIINPQQMIATNLTGWFPVTYNKGNKYLFVLYKYDSNIILLLPINSITDK